MGDPIRDAPKESGVTNIISPRLASLKLVDLDANKQQVLQHFGFGFDAWLKHKAGPEVLERIARIDTESLGRAQFNQLLHLCHEAGVSDAFFTYYWLSSPQHVYDITQFPPYDPNWFGQVSISSLDHLRWGIYRFYVDALLFFGNVRTAFRTLRAKNELELDVFFRSKRMNSEGMKRRGPALPLVPVTKDDRYLISEMACKSCAAADGNTSELGRYLGECYQAHILNGGGRVTVRKLLEFGFKREPIPERQTEFLFSADSILEDEVDSAEALTAKFTKILKTFQSARVAALKNTELFLSMASDLDIYVATSMRDREDFRKMATFCEQVFRHPTLKPLHLRYFDPTVSAAEGHEDKGLIECLMVKCSKVLVYCAGKRDSYGKDAEAAMALSQGKPVIFYCDEQQRSRFFSDVHPLSRLIDFKTGVAVGAMVTSSQDQVIELLSRIFENKMEYELEHRPSGSVRLKERLTGSVVRLQTGDSLLRETFWNYYHGSV